MNGVGFISFTIIAKASLSDDGELKSKLKEM